MYLLCASLWRSSGHRMSLSSVATMAVKAGRCARSFCQQSSIRLWMASGQSIGAGNLKNEKSQNNFFYKRKKKKEIPVTLFNGFDYVLIGPVPIGPLSVGHDLPADDAKAPDVAGRGEFAESYRFRRRPPDWDLATLNERKETIIISEFPLEEKSKSGVPWWCRHLRWCSQFLGSIQSRRFCRRAER